MADTADVVIIGGGVIGCAIAYDLAGAGLKVILLEQEAVGSGASSAAAGLIVPLHAAEEGERTPLFELYLASARRFPDLVAELEEATGLRVDFDRSGPLRVAATEDEEELLRESFEAWERIEALTVEWVDGKTLREMEPELAPDVCCGVFSKDESRLHPGRFTRALACGAAQRGARIRTGCPALGVRQRNGRFEAVQTLDGEISARELIIAAGAWSRVPCAWFGVHVPIGPARGQMVALRPPTRLLRHSLLSFNGAIHPALDGTVHVGSTLELVGFDTRTTAEGIATILGILPRLLPALNPAPVERVWAGLRPWCEDGLPAVGRLPGCEGAILAGGHFKLGILGSAITARTVKTLVADGQVDPLIAPFTPQRFAEGA